MLFCSGDNDLESEIFTNVNELELTGSSDQVNMVAETDWWHKAGTSETLSTGEGVGRWFVTKDSDMVRIKSTLVQTLDEINTATAEAIKEFVVWAAANYPAQKYILIVGSHGSGWRSGVVKPEGFGQDFTTDPSRGSIMSLTDLKSVLPSIKTALGKNLDILAIDCCLNGMVEVAYQIKDYVDILTASEEIIQGDGYPFTDMAADLVAAPTMSASSFATDIVNKYYNQKMTTLAQIDITKITNVADRVKTFTTLFTTSEMYEALRDILNDSSGTTYTVQRYDDVTFRDLWHMCDVLIAQKGSDSAYSAITAECAAIKTAVEQAVVISKYTIGGTRYSVANSHGISIYCPTPQTTTYEAGYDTVDFSTYTGWGAFLQKFN